MPETKHSEDYYANSDIDWFCELNGVNIHVASLGHKIPEAVEKTLPQVYGVVSGIEMAPWGGREGIWYNEGLVRRVVGLERDEDIARYLYTFVVMARKGFYSFAPLTSDPTDGGYYLMAKPANYKHKAIEGVFRKEIPNLDVKAVEGLIAYPLVDIIKSE